MSRYEATARRIVLDRTLLTQLYIDRTLSQKDIAVLLGVSAMTVNRRLREYGIEAPKRSRTSELEPIPDWTGDEDRRKLTYIRAQLDAGTRGAEDMDLLRARYLDIVEHPNPRIGWRSGAVTDPT